MTQFWYAFKKNPMCFIAGIAALVTCFLVRPDREYLGYFDLRTLICLFATLLVVCALRNVKFFTIISRRLVRLCGTLRGLFFALVVITFVGSMLLANDMALITFLPLGYFALSVTQNEKHMAYLFVLQNISANLGGLLTPFGNPQNLYLYSHYHIPTGEFCAFMLPPFLVAITLLCAACLFVKNERLVIRDHFSESIQRPKTMLYLSLFALSLLVVFRILHPVIGLVLVAVPIFFLDRDAVKMVDYPLLLTFAFFFVFAGNLSRVEAVREFFGTLLQKDPFTVSLLSCQGISNVPSAILLSRFTDDWRALLLGVNIGSAGTLISSLASLITFSEFRVLYPEKTKQYLLLFTVVNLVFLVILYLCSKLFFL